MRGPRRLPDGSEHYAFYGLIDLLKIWEIDMLCVQKTCAPSRASLPILLFMMVPKISAVVRLESLFIRIRGLGPCLCGLLHIGSTRDAFP